MIWRNSRIRRKYGIEPAEYDALLAAQGGACAACGSTDSGDRRFEPLLVDHDHETGAVRGLLCQPCNLALGMVKDDPDRLLSLAAYLLKSADVLSTLGATA